MDLTTLRLLFVGGVLIIAAVVVLLSLGIQQLDEWVKSYSGPPDQARGRASERVFPGDHVLWRNLR
jgi:hypothetical protein